eukprot:scaffold131_cov206-Alexandrium_tamarense.AAC.6
MSKRRSTLAAVATIASIASSTSALDSDCQPPNSPPYSGYSLKQGTGCTQYVYCQNGIVSSTTTCPGGLLFNGQVGIGGVCDWASSVVCKEGADAVANAPAADAATTVAPLASWNAPGNVASTVKPATTATQATSAASQQATQAVNGNPSNHYCGTSREDAAQLCVPCPSGSLLECADVQHGCFQGITCTTNSNDSAPMASPTAPSGGGLTLADLGIGGGGGSAPMASSPNGGGLTLADLLLSAPTAPTSTVPAAPRYDRNKFADPANVDFSKYDRINYAFFQPDLDANIFGTDEWADPQLLWGPYDYNPQEQVTSGPGRNYMCSWDSPEEGSTTPRENCAYHKISEGIIARAHAVGTEVMPSIGGWTLSDNFPTIAASDTLRRKFAQNCVKLITEYGFDGIDIDWEYPAYEDHSGTPADTENFTLFLQAIRDALDVLGQSTGRFYGLTAALPCGPDKIEKIQVEKITNILTELNLMSYDLHGAFDVLTGINAPMFDQGWTDKSKRWSVHGCVNNYVDRGVPLAKMNLGLPFYGRSFRKATGMKQVHSGPDDINFHLDEGSPQYFNIVKALGRMTTYRHEKTQTQYAVFNDGQRGLVSYDDARAICDKVHYANQRGMHGFLVWEISGDMLDNGDTPLIDATNAKIQNPGMECSKLRDPTWALSDTEYHYAPPEPQTVDWSKVDPLKTNAAPMGYSIGNSPPAPTPNSSPMTPTLNANTVGINNNVSNNNVSSNSGSTAAVAQAPTSTDCPPDHTGYWPGAGCTSYMYCQAGKIVGAPLNCVPGTLFDVTISVCTWATSVPGC